MTRESSAIILLMKKRISKRERERERKGHTFQFDSVRVNNNFVDEKKGSAQTVQTFLSARLW